MKTHEPDVKELIHCVTSRKSKKVLHVVDSHDSFLEVINTVGFWTLEYHVTGAKILYLSLYTLHPRGLMSMLTKLHRCTNLAV